MLNQNTALYGILTFALASPVYASLNCTSHPSCESLGYSKTETCSGGTLIQCPFDTSYKKCVKELVYDELCSQYPLAECPSGASCYKCENGKPNYMAYGCSSGYTNINGDCVKAYEDCSSAGYEYSDNRGKVCTSSAEITLLDGSKTMCYASCVDAYEDCSAAGYGHENNTGMYCKNSGRITLLDGTIKTCYSNCVKAYENCDEAGYEIDTRGMYCETSATITLLDGSTTTCLKDCVNAYESCEAIGDGYYSAQPSSAECSSADFYLTSSGLTKCYYDCTSVSTGGSSSGGSTSTPSYEDCDCGDACERFGTSSSDCIRQIGCEAQCRLDSTDTDPCSDACYACGHTEANRQDCFECCTCECRETFDRELAAGYYGPASEHYEACVDACYQRY